MGYAIIPVDTTALVAYVHSYPAIALFLAKFVLGVPIFFHSFNGVRHLVDLHLAHHLTIIDLGHCICFNLERSIFYWMGRSWIDSCFFPAFCMLVIMEIWWRSGNHQINEILSMMWWKMTLNKIPCCHLPFSRFFIFLPPFLPLFYLIPLLLDPPKLPPSYQFLSVGWIESSDKQRWKRALFVWNISITEKFQQIWIIWNCAQKVQTILYLLLFVPVSQILAA